MSGKGKKTLIKPLSGFQELAKQNRCVFPTSYFHSRNFLVKRTMECYLLQVVIMFHSLFVLLLEIEISGTGEFTIGSAELFSGRKCYSNL